MFSSSKNQFNFTQQQLLKDKLNEHLWNINERILNQIQEGRVIINFPHNIPRKATSQLSNLQDRLKQLEELKEKTKEKLKEIQKKQQEINRNRVQLMKQQKVKNKLQKSIFKKQDKIKIKQAKNLLNQFENNISNKIYEILKNIQLHEQQLKKNQQIDKAQKRKQTLLKLAQKRLSIEQNRQKSLETDQNIKKQYQNRIKNFRNYIHIQKQHEDDEKKLQKNKAAQTLLQERKKSQQTNFPQLKKHSQQYEQQRKEKQRQKQLQLKQLELSHRPKTIFYQNTFSRRLQQLDEDKKQQIIKKNQDKKELKDKMNHYQNYIQQKFKPKITYQSKFHKKKQSQVLEQLSNRERTTKGNQYMEVSKQRKKRYKTSELSQNQSSYCIHLSLDFLREQSTKTEISLTEKYPNYLQQLRIKNKNNKGSILEKALREKKLSVSLIEKAVQFIDTKQSMNKLSINKDPKNSLFRAALQKISLLQSMNQNI